MTKRTTVVSLVCILLLGVILRTYNLNQWPREGATFDEYAWTWLGMSLITRGVPTSWSPHPQYKSVVAYKNPRGASFNLVTPYLEHPPLFGLLVGGFALLRGARIFDDIALPVIRPLSMLLAMFSLLAVYLLSRQLYDGHIALLSMFLYAIAPTVVVGSRLVQNENFFTPLFVFVMYLTVKYLKTNKSAYLIFSFLVCSILPLAKVPWVAAPIAVTGILLMYKKFREATLMVSLVASVLFTYVLYGFYFDGKLFIELMGLQFARYDMSFDSLYALFMNPIVTDRLFIDGWIYVGWISLALVTARRDKRTVPLLIGFFSYFFIYLAGIPNEPGHGWYRYPFYPFLAIGSAVVFFEYFNKNYFLTAGALLFLGLSLLQHTWYVFFGFSYIILRLYILLCGAGLIPVIFSKKRTSWVATISNYSSLCIIVALTFLSIISYNEQ